MANILAFTPRAAAPTRPQGQEGQQATVIIFPGVRYERTPTHGEPAKPWLPASWANAFQPVTQS